MTDETVNLTSVIDPVESSELLDPAPSLVETPSAIETRPDHEIRSSLMEKTGTRLHARTDGGGTDFWAVSYGDHAVLTKAMEAGEYGLEMVGDRLHFLGKYVRPEAS